jgi:hypothetical protein
MVPGTQMKTFVEGNLAVVIGGLAFMAVLGLMRISSDEGQRADFRVASRWLAIYLLLRINDFWLEDLIPTEWHAYLRVGWILAFAFGITRVAVATALWL